MDAQIGLILDQLDELGLAEDTIVVYLTDNGGSTCNYGVNLPLRGTKYTLWEGGVRVPFLLRWPGQVPAGTTRAGLTSSMDILPTALAAAGAALPLTRTATAWTCWAHSAPAMRPCTGIAAGSGRCAAATGSCSWVEPGSPVADAIRDVEHAEPGSGFFLCNLAADPGRNHRPPQKRAGHHGGAPGPARTVGGRADGPAMSDAGRPDRPPACGTRPPGRRPGPQSRCA